MQYKNIGGTIDKCDCVSAHAHNCTCYFVCSGDCSGYSSPCIIDCTGGYCNPHGDCTCNYNCKEDGKYCDYYLYTCTCNSKTSGDSTCICNVQTCTSHGIECGNNCIVNQDCSNLCKLDCPSVCRCDKDTCTCNLNCAANDWCRNVCRCNHYCPCNTQAVACSNNCLCNT